MTGSVKSGPRRAVRLCAAIALVLGSALALSCNVNEYCLNCAVIGDGGTDGGDPGDGGDGDGGTDDASDASTCVPTGLEVCDGDDNDCDGATDEGPLPTIGELCTEQRGACAGGVNQCVNGTVSCTKPPMPETCDLVDNNCNGVVDEGDPGGGGKCGTDQGECVAGVNRCTNGALQCIGAVGGTTAPFGTAESCNAKDDDCDGTFDEGLANLGSCGTTGVGECSLGTRMCMGGGVVCVGATGPAFELCDALDQDCDGNPTNGYDLATDPRNCGACGNVCDLPHATNGCANNQCTIAACDASFHDNNGTASDGCEFGPCTIQGNEVCNGIDDDCDGTADDNLQLPSASSFCRTAGECATGTTVVCGGANGVRCEYADPDVSEVNGVITAETLCDGKDNDCDGAIDEGQPNLGHACDNGQNGQCRTTGVFVCNPANLNGPAVCDAPAGGGATTEVCDGIDNDCNGTIDDNAITGDLAGQEWVTIPGTSVEIMKYEASRPDATAALVGNLGTHACSRPAVQPWVNITYPQAQAVCSGIGARLCTETEWQRMCAPAPAYPVAGPTGTTDFVFLEAEDAFARTTGSGDAWQVQNVADFSGLSALRALPDNGTSIALGSALGNAPRLDFQVSLAAGVQYAVWVRMAAVDVGGNTVHVGLTAGASAGAAAQTLTISSGFAAWKWVRSTNLTATAVAGTHTLSVYMAKDGTRVDAVALVRGGNGTTPPFDERTWAYQTNPKVAQDATCNGDPFDTNPALAGDQDGILATGSLPACFANGAATADVFDMSGNVKEWAQARAAGQNPLRGGASNNETSGLTCGLNFTLADDQFFFPNVGFRCCR